MNGSAAPIDSAMLDAEREVRELENKLAEARSRLNGAGVNNDAVSPAPSSSYTGTTNPPSHRAANLD